MKPAAPAVEADSAASAGAASDLRLFVNRQIFRGTIFSIGSVAVAMDLAGVPKWILWDFVKFQARNLARALGVEVVVRGAVHVAEGGPFVFTPNHQSHFDIVALLGHLPGHGRFAAKKEIFREPILGAAMRAMGMLPVDREDPSQSLDVLNECVAAGNSMVIFPEGTRSPDGSLLPFKKGAFVAAIEIGAPVVPVVLKGSRAIMPKGGYLSIHPGTVEVVILPPIPTRGLGYDDRERLRDRVREIIADEFARP